MTEARAKAWVEVEVDGAMRHIPLEPGMVCRIGRGAQNKIILTGELVSRCHAILQGSGMGEFYLTDLASRNGTLVNGRPATVPVVLHTGDVITVGNHQLKFHQESLPAPAAQPQEETPIDATSVRVSWQLISVLVADIRDYTGLARRLPQEKLSEVIRTFMQESGRALVQQGSWVQKYIGDAVMSVWVHNDLAPCAYEMMPILIALTNLYKIAASLQARFQLDEVIRIGAGLNTGLAATGNMGSDVVSDYTALGDAVNKAFRLESATRQIGTDLVLGEASYRCLREQPGMPDLPQPHMIQLKGYKDPELVYALSIDDLTKVIESCQAAVCAGPPTEADRK